MGLPPTREPVVWRPDPGSHVPLVLPAPLSPQADSPIRGRGFPGPHALLPSPCSSPGVPGTRSPAAAHSSASPSHSTRSRSNGRWRPGAIVRVPRALPSAIAAGPGDLQHQPRPRPRLPGQTPRLGPPSGPPLDVPPRLAR